MLRTLFIQAWGIWSGAMNIWQPLFPSRYHSRGGVKLSCRPYILPVCSTCLWLSRQPQWNDMPLISGRGFSWIISRTSLELQEWYQTIKHELQSILHWSPGTEGLLITAEKRALDLTRKVINIYPDVGVESHASQAKEDRPKDCTEAKWWYKKAKGKKNKFWTFVK